MVRSGGKSFILTGGRETSATVFAGGHQCVSSGGLVVATQVSSGGKSHVRSGGLASAVTVLTGGLHTVSSGGSAIATQVRSGGKSFILRGGLESGATVFAGGHQCVSSGGIIVATVVSSGGKSHVRNGGLISATTLLAGGEQLVSSGGIAQNAVISSGGVQRIFIGGRASSTDIRAGGAQVASAGGSAVGARVSSGGTDIVRAGGLSLSATLLAGGLQRVSAGGLASATVVNTGGALSISSGGIARNAQVNAGGRLNVFQGGAASSFTVSSGAAMTMSGNGTFAGTNTVHGNLTIAGAGNSIGNLTASSTATISYDVRNVNVNATTVMLRATTQLNTTQAARYAVVVNGWQAIGAYELSSNLMMASNTAFTISQGATALGTATLNGTGLSVNGVNYALRTTGAQVNLTLTAISGNMYKAGGSGTLTGTENCDIFYGGGGTNNTINVGNGRDVVVYDAQAWGQDTVISTGGTTTLLFSGLSAADITAVRSGTSMEISRTGDASQRITVHNWNDNTHEIVYGDTLSAFNAWLNAAAPTTAQQNAARNEVWQQVGLLAA
jgi:autotransporter passenger strand-loop-strand repeat protein